MPFTLGISSGAGSLKNTAEPFLLGYRVNWIENPSFEVNTTNWSSVAGAVLTRLTSGGYSGPACLQVQNSSTSATQVGSSSGRIPLVAGSGSYTASVYIKLGVGNSTANYFIRQLQYENQDSSSTVSAGNGGIQSLSYTGDWVRLSYTFTKAAAANFMLLRVATSSNVNGETFLVDSMMLEKSSSAGSYFDGDSGFWTGTSHASISATTPY
jgi:hypothetical protein